MAAVTRVKPHFVSPTAYEVVDRGVMLVDVVAGDQVILTSTGWTKAPTGALEGHGMAINDAKAGERGVDILVQGEMDGWSGLTQGTDLYPSGTTAGLLDTTKPAGAINRVRAVSPTRIRVNYV